MAAQKEFKIGGAGSTVDGHGKVRVQCQLIDSKGPIRKNRSGSFTIDDTCVSAALEDLQDALMVRAMPEVCELLNELEAEAAEAAAEEAEAEAAEA